MMPKLWCGAMLAPILLTAGCTGSHPTAPSSPPPAAAAVSPGVLFSLSGVVSDAISGRPIQGAAVSISASASFTGGGLQWLAGSTQSNANGRYQISRLTDGLPGAPQFAGLGPVAPTTIWVYANQGPSGSMSTQPCAATTTVVPGNTATLDLTITIAPIGDPSAVPSTALVSPPGSRTISGTVFETTADGRHPVQDAKVGWEALIDRVVADTRSDAAGHYALCGLPNTPTSLFAVKLTGSTQMPTYVSVEAGANTVDIDLLR